MKSKTHVISVFIFILLPSIGSSQTSIATQSSNSTAFTVASGDLLETNLASVDLVGSFNVFYPASVLSDLTDGQFGTHGTDTSSSVAVVQNSTITYSMDLASSPGGYEIQEVHTYAGWDSGRDGQEYLLQFSTILAPEVFSVGISVPQFNPLLGGIVSSKVSITDASGTLATNVAKIRFTFTSFENDGTAYREFDVIGVPIPDPKANSDTVVTKEDQGVNVVLTGSSAAKASLTFRVTKGPKHGKLTGKAPNLRYFPKKDFTGTDSIQFVVSDGKNTSAPATIRIKVKPVNDRPVVKAIKRNLVSGEKDVFALKAKDVDTPQNKLRFQVVNPPKKGQLKWTKNGKVSYLAPRNFTGVVRFSYFATDGKLKSKKKTVVLVVKERKKS